MILNKRMSLSQLTYWKSSPLCPKKSPKDSSSTSKPWQGQLHFAGPRTWPVLLIEKAILQGKSLTSNLPVEALLHLPWWVNCYIVGDWVVEYQSQEIFILFFRVSGFPPNPHGSSSSMAQVYLQKTKDDHRGWTELVKSKLAPLNQNEPFYYYISERQPNMVCRERSWHRKKYGFLHWKIDSSPRPRDVLASIAHQTFHSAFLLFGTGWQRDLMLTFLVRSVSRVIELHWRLSKARFCWSFVELCVTGWTWIYGGKLFLELDLGLSCASVALRQSSWAASWRHMQ